MLVRLTLTSDGDLNLAMYQALKTSLTLDDALDLCEIDDVGRSWRAASQRNEDKISAEIRRRGREKG